MQLRRFAMRSSTLFALIVVGHVSVATAEPKQEEISGRVRLEDKPAEKSDAPRASSEWVELASPTPAKHGTEIIVVGDNAGVFAQLRIDATRGRTSVRKVKVFFSDGDTKTVRLDRMLTAKRARSAYVDLGTGKPIDRIIVMTETHTSGEYAVFGTGARASETVVGTR